MQGQYFVCVTGNGVGGGVARVFAAQFQRPAIFLGDAGSHFVGTCWRCCRDGTFYRPGEQTHLPVLIPLLVLAVPLLIW